MGGKIPEPIRRKVLIEWLEGHPQRHIARDNQIGIGTVSEIIKTIRERGTETQIDVLREIAVMLRRQGLSIDDFARSIRLNQFLNEIGLEEEKVEDFVKQLEIHCFKRGLTLDAFMDLVANISSLSDSLGVPVEELPESIKSSKELLDDTNLTIKNRFLMLKQVNKNYNVTITDLEEYRRNRPVIETLEAKNLELEKAKRRISDLEAELFKRQYEWTASNTEFELVNTELKQPIESPELYILAKDLCLHPSKYAHIIRTMRQRSEPQTALVEKNKVNIIIPPPPPALSPSTILSLPSGTPIYMTGQNLTLPTQSEFPSSLPGHNPSTGTTTATQPTNVLSFNNSNTTTAITLAPPPSNPTPNNITSIGSTTSESNTTPRPNTPSKPANDNSRIGQ